MSSIHACLLKDEGAVALFTEALKLKPKDVRALHVRAFAKLHLEDYQGAVADLTEALKLEPNYVRDLLDRGFAKSQLKDYQGAVADFTEALKLEPKDARALQSRGCAKLQLKDCQGAVADITEALKLEPKDVGALGDRGSAKLQLKDYQGAVADFTEALKLEPKDVRALHGRGFAKLHRKDCQGAVADITEALKLEPKDVRAFYDRGSAKLQLKNFQGAVADFTDAFKLDPKDDRVRDARISAEQSLADAAAAASAAEKGLLAELEGDSVCKHKKTSKKANKKVKPVTESQSSRSSAGVESDELRSGARHTVDADPCQGSSGNCSTSVCANDIEHTILHDTPDKASLSCLPAEPALLPGKKLQKRAKKERKSKQLEQKQERGACMTVDEDLVEEACVDMIGAPQAKVVAPTYHDLGTASEIYAAVLEPVKCQGRTASRSAYGLPHTGSSSSSDGAQNIVVNDPRLEILSVFDGLNLPVEVARKLTDPDGDYNYADLVSFARLVQYQDLRDAGLKVADARSLMANLKPGGEVYNRLVASGRLMPTKAEPPKCGDEFMAATRMTAAAYLA